MAYTDPDTVLTPYMDCVGEFGNHDDHEGCASMLRGMYGYETAYAYYDEIGYVHYYTEYA